MAKLIVTLAICCLGWNEASPTTVTYHLLNCYINYLFSIGRFIKGCSSAIAAEISRPTQIFSIQRSIK